MEKRSFSRLFNGKPIVAVLAAILSLCLVVTMTATGTILAQAANKFDPNAECSIKAIMPETSDTQYKDMPAIPAGLSCDLYKIASAVPSSGYDVYSFKAETPFTDLAGLLQDLDKIDSLSKNGASQYSDKYAEIAQAATQLVKQNNIAAKANVEVDATKNLGKQPGLYLILVRGNKPAKDYIVEHKNDEGVTSLITVANSDIAEFRFTPQLVAVPGRDNGVSNNSANRTDWVYDETVTLKPEWSPLYGSLEIVKTLRTFENGQPATFVFQIEATDNNGNTVYSNVESLVFNGATSQKIVVDKIPAGAKVEVTEQYSGAVYQATTPAKANATIVADSVASVSFENDYTGSGNGGGSVTNSFSYTTGEGQSSADAQWVWSKDGEEQK